VTSLWDRSLRSALWLGFFAAILTAWWWMFAMARMAGLDWLGRPMPMDMSMPMDGMTMDMDMTMDMNMSMTGFGVLFPMWAIMMAAMMLPTLVPTLRAYEDLMRSANGSRAGWVGLIGGYLAVWVGFAAGIAALQVALTEAGVLNDLGRALSLWITAALLAAVGLFQFTRVKEICHGVCHAPTVYFLGHWRPGAAGGGRMGLALGAYCVGCCWGFMALGFVGGVMSLLWMGLATLFMVFEKLPDIGRHLTRPAGAALLAGALGVAVWAALDLA